MRHCLSRTGSIAAVLLLSVILLGGCGTKTDQEGTDPAAAPEAVETLSPEEEAAAKERRDRLAVQEDGFLLDKGYLYAVDTEGNFLRNTYVGILYFEEDGRYTSGSKDLDRLVAGVIRKHTDDGMSRMEKLRAMYEYTRDNIKYVGFDNHDNSYRPAHGADGWMVECAIFSLENGRGNCYHFAATLAALARGLGYQAYATSGIIGSEEQEHGWVEIVDGNGSVWYCDPETEFARKYWMNEEYDLFYKSGDDIGSVTGIGYQQLTDPFEAERKEAEEQGRPQPSPAPKA